MSASSSYANAVASTSARLSPSSRDPRLPFSSAAPLPGAAVDSLPNSLAAAFPLSSAAQSLVRAKDLVSALLTAADSRPSRRKVPGATPGVGACDPCRKVRGELGVSFAWADCRWCRSSQSAMERTERPAADAVGAARLVCTRRTGRGEGRRDRQGRRENVFARTQLMELLQYHDIAPGHLLPHRGRALQPRSDSTTVNRLSTRPPFPVRLVGLPSPAGCQRARAAGTPAQRCTGVESRTGVES